jgi:curved DNA-binding protein CbpA
MKMRPQILHILLLCAFAALVAAWTKEDHEIFRLRDELEASEGGDVTFYDFLGIQPSATQDDINKAFRKKSKALHPDKVKHSFIASKSTTKPKKPGDKRKPSVHASKGPSERELQRFVKEASLRYGRLGVVADILKGESRARYDHFLKNGFPAWRGTGWYYKRYRPGFGTVLVGLFVMFAGVAHYVVLRLSYTKQREFVDRYIRHARKAAWGTETAIGGVPGLNGSAMAAPGPPPTAEEDDPYAGMNRKQRRQMERDEKKPSKKTKLAKRHGTETPPITAAAAGPKKRIVAENGKVLVVDSVGNVFLEEEEEDEEGNVSVKESLLDPDEIQYPTIYDTAVYRLPLFLYHKATDRFLKRGEFSEIVEVLEEAEPAQTLVSDNGPSSQDSTEGFEILETTGVPEQANGGGPRKRNKKGKK